jgi:hypothetical protein
MKKLTVVFALLLGLLPSWLQASGVPAGYPQFADYDKCVTWASRQVAGGYAYVSGTFIEATNSQTFVEVSTNVHDPVIVLKLLASKVVSFMPTHPEIDPISTAMVLRDKNWHVLFSGANWNIRLVQTPTGEWMLPEGAEEIEVNTLAYYQYVYVGQNVYWAYVDVRNEDGTHQGYRYLNIQDGWLEFSTDLLGAGDLILYTQTDGVVGYNLQNGGERITSDLQMMNIRGDISSLIQEIPETEGSIKVNPVSQDGYGVSRPVHVVITANRTLQVSGVTTEGIPAVKVIVVNMETGSEQEIEIGDVPAKVDLVPGDYHFNFEWKGGQFGKSPYGPVSSGGGKGKSEG